MKQIVASSNGIEVIESPAPICGSREICVEVNYSFISTGTELSTLEQMQESSSNISKHVISNPNLIKKVGSKISTKGIHSTLKDINQYVSKRKSQTYKLTPLGYSVSGKVISVGEGVTTFSEGDLVACAGATLATHSEIVCVPENLSVHIPPDCDLQSASSVAVGSIAMHAIHQSQLQLGEHILIVGLGTVGIITAQLANAAGYRVIGYDPDENKINIAKSLGILDVKSYISEVKNHIQIQTGHMGVDSSLVTAKSNSSQPLDIAIDSTKQKGRVIIVGDVLTQFDRSDILAKEIEIIPSYSYGPGRQDAVYEKYGIDYPYHYVRWTEKRNMSEYLRLISNSKIDIKSITQSYDLFSAKEAYQNLKSSNQDSSKMAVSIIYNTTDDTKSKRTTKIATKKFDNISKHSIGVAIAGAGKFAQNTHIPNLKKINSLAHITGILNTKGTSAIEIAKIYDAGYATTSYQEILDDPNTNAILIATRHNMHNKMLIDGINAGKNIFIEKPLAVDKEELDKFSTIVDSKGQNLIIQTGFNRRFSPLITKLSDMLSNSKDPLTISYIMNVGYLDAEHWLRDSEGLGRNIGEACHIYDLFTFLTDSKIRHISASSINPKNKNHSKNENFTANFKFEDGSIANLTFTSMGSTIYPKEQMKIFQSESVYYLNDYKTLDVYNKNKQTITNHSGSKGHEEELRSFINAIKNESSPPIPYWQQIQATHMALEIERLIESN